MRHDDYEDSMCLGLGVAFAIILVFALVLMLTGCDCDQPESDAGRFTANEMGFTVKEAEPHVPQGNIRGWEFATITDTETGVVYLVFNNHNGTCSIGGITPLLQGDGSVTIDEGYAGDGSKS